jgi:DNA invertase Pin-like site-specific DNA recombinase
MKRGACYLRVSRESQDVAHQRPQVLALCRGLGFSPVIYEEKASGRSMARPKWARIVERANAGELGAVVAWSIDRLGRNFYGIQSAFQALERAKVTIATVQEPWVFAMSSSELRPLLVAIMGWVADFQLQRMRQQIKAGLETARKRGRVIGRPRVLGGATLARAVELRERGISWSAIRSMLAAEKRGAFAKGTIQSAVDRYNLKGRKP